MAKQDREWNLDLVGDYDRIAELYAEAYADDLGRAPFDQDILNRFVEHVQGPVCDPGCGPGYVAAYLRQKRVATFGVDLSTRMIEVAKRLYPEMSFWVGAGSIRWCSWRCGVFLFGHSFSPQCRDAGVSRNGTCTHP